MTIIKSKYTDIPIIDRHVHFENGLEGDEKILGLAGQKCNHMIRLAEAASKPEKTTDK